jgi:hypothetical protein
MKRLIGPDWDVHHAPLDEAEIDMMNEHEAQRDHL